MNRRQHLQPVKIGLLLDGRVQERWVVESLRQALAVRGVSLVAIAIAHGIGHVTWASRLHRMFDLLDEQLRCRGEPLFVPVDVVGAFKAPVLEIGVLAVDGAWHPDEAGVAGLQRCQVDVWLCFTAVAPRRPMQRVSRLGIWGLEIGQHVPATNIWGAAMEPVAGSPVTMVSVVDYSAPGDEVLYRTFGATVTNSARRNRLGSLHKGASLFRRMLDQLTREENGWRPGRSGAPVPADYPALRTPTVSAVGRLSWRLAANVAANRLRLLKWRNQWQVAYYFANEGDPEFRFECLRYLVPPKDCFWADPFAVEWDGRSFIFFEEMPYRTRKGRIMAIEVFEDGAAADPLVALERPYHLSYPFLFAWNGALYMMPETATNGTVELYRCDEFPGHWSLHRVCLDNIRAYDPTLWQASDRWWMFVNVAEPGADSSDELHLYWADSPLGTWTAHRANPVVSDVRCARPAGPLFARDGVLYRPSQDCSQAYGHSVLINRVERLHEDEYRETAVHRISPGWRKDILHVHTFGASQRLRVIDYLVSRKQRF